jgi:sodium/hydrogen antiporter
MKDLARRDADTSIPGSNRLFSANNVQSGASAAAAKVVGAVMAGVNPPKPEELDGAAGSSGSSSSRSSSDASEHRALAMRTRALLAHAQDSEDTGPSTLGRHVVAAAGSPSSDVPETAAERRRREQALKGVEDADEPAGKRPVAVVTAADRRRQAATTARKDWASGASRDDAETPAEWRRRIAALGHSEEQEGDEDGAPRAVPTLQSESSTASGRSRGIRFAEDPVRGHK